MPGRVVGRTKPLVAKERGPDSRLPTSRDTFLQETGARTSTTLPRWRGSNQHCKSRPAMVSNFGRILIGGAVETCTSRPTIRRTPAAPPRQAESEPRADDEPSIGRRGYNRFWQFWANLRRKQAGMVDVSVAGWSRRRRRKWKNGKMLWKRGPEGETGVTARPNFLKITDFSTESAKTEVFCESV